MKPMREEDGNNANTSPISFGNVGSVNTYPCYRNAKGGKKRIFVPGDLGMIMDSSAPRGSWMLGRVREAFPDKRGLVRVVRLKTKTSIIERPVTKICLLNEVED